MNFTNIVESTWSEDNKDREGGKINFKGRGCGNFKGSGHCNFNKQWKKSNSDYLIKKEVETVSDLSIMGEEDETSITKEGQISIAIMVESLDIELQITYSNNMKIQ